VCGSKTLTKCPICGKDITGGKLLIDDYNDVSIHPASVPLYCEGCGNPFPWVNEGDTLKNDEIGLLKPESTDTEIFIVHGHNEKIKDELEDFLITLGLKPIILHKQPRSSRTIMENVEHYSKSVRFAIILLTADDVGSPTSPANRVIKEKTGVFKKPSYTIEEGKIWGALNLRARQNVIFEFGYFIGLLGRNNVAALCEKDVELPSDVDGLLYIEFDENGGWKNEIIKELRAAGISITAENQKSD